MKGTSPTTRLAPRCGHAFLESLQLEQGQLEQGQTLSGPALSVFCGVPIDCQRDRRGHRSLPGEMRLHGGSIKRTDPVGPDSQTGTGPVQGIRKCAGNACRHPYSLNSVCSVGRSQVVIGSIERFGLFRGIRVFRGQFCFFISGSAGTRSRPDARTGTGPVRVVCFAGQSDALIIGSMRTSIPTGEPPGTHSHISWANPML